VNTTIDVVDYTDGVLSLREAVLIVNNPTVELPELGAEIGQIDTSDGNEFGFNDTILFDEDAPGLDGGAITYSSGQIVISQSVNIDASELTNSLTIDANNSTPTVNGRVFEIASGTHVLINGLTLTGGNVLVGEGGAIFSLGTLSIHNSNITGNYAENGGGGITIEASASNQRVLEISNSVISGNTSGAEGGGIAVYAGAVDQTVLISGSTFSGNQSSGFGGAVYIDDVWNGSFNFSEIDIQSTAFNDNNAQRGGGAYLRVVGGTVRFDLVDFNENEAIDFGGGLLVTASGTSISVTGASEFRDNVSGGGNFGLGGGLYSELTNGSSLMISGALIANNEAAAGGGVYVVSENSGVTLQSSTVSGNTAVGGPIFQADGGGIFLRVVEDSSATLDNLIIEGNDALTSVSGTSRGGGVFLDLGVNAGFGPNTPVQDVVVAVTDSISSNNTAFDGGGVYAILGSNDPHSQAEGIRLDFLRTQFLNNEAGSRGGGLYTRQGAGADDTLDESTVSGNDAGVDFEGTGAAIELPNSGGGVYAYLFAGDDNVLPTDGSGNPIQGNASDTDNWEASLIITNSTIDSNTAGFQGGGVQICTKRQDFDYDVRALVGFANTTISGNIATGREDDELTTGVDEEVVSEGGGVHIAIYQAAEFPNEVEGIDVEFINATVFLNQADIGGGIYGKVPSVISGGGNQSIVNTILHNTIVAGNTTYTPTVEPNNYYGTINADESNYNLFGPVSSLSFFDHDGTHGAITIGTSGTNPVFLTGIGQASPLTNIVVADNDPQLSALANFGGPTQTHAILVSSPVIDNGADALAVVPFTTTPLAYDQRGSDPVDYFRVIDGPTASDPAGFRVDIGAYEAQRGGPIGDYNRDGCVDAADYTVWRDTLGLTVPIYTGADGNGDGVIDQADYLLWRSNFGSCGGGSILFGDMDGNAVVNADDYAVWAASANESHDPGVAYNAMADVNNDGWVDSADFEIWWQSFGTVIDAQTGNFVVQTGLLGTNPNTTAPVVVAAMLGSTSSSRDYAGIVGNGLQLTRSELDSVESIRITFSQNVTVAQTDLTLVNLDGTSPTITGFSYDANTQSATWTLAFSLADGRFLLRLSDSVVNDAGRALDGEFTNPWTIEDATSSIFPSGDGEDGGEFRFRFTMLAGDTDGDNIDGTTDYTAWHSYEPGLAIVSTTVDEFDSDYSYGDLSLREAVYLANQATGQTRIELPSATYLLTLTGTESGTTPESHNDIDIRNSLIELIGDGAGRTIIDASGLNSSGSSPTAQSRALEVITGELSVDGVTFTGGHVRATTAHANGGAIFGNSGTQLDIVNSAFVDNHADIGSGSTYFATGGAVRFNGGGSIRSSVFTENSAQSNGGAVFAFDTTANVFIGSSVFGLNQATGGSGPGYYDNVRAGNTVISEGHNLSDADASVYYPVFTGVGDLYTTTAPNLIVTAAHDELNTSDGSLVQSLRDAISLANSNSDATEIWVPAWHFELTLVGMEGTGAAANDTNDFDIRFTTTVRGVGPGLTVLDASGLSSDGVGLEDRLFEVSNGATLNIDRVTLTGGHLESTATENASGGAIKTYAGTTLNVSNSAFVDNHVDLAPGSPKFAVGGAVSVYGNASFASSVFVNNSADTTGGAIFANPTAGTVTVASSIFAQNVSTSYQNVRWGSTVTTLGGNLADADGSIAVFDETLATDPDVVMAPSGSHYLVTSVADTFDHSNDSYSLSLREAVDLANDDSGASEVWLPAWDFALTRAGSFPSNEGAAFGGTLQQSVHERIQYGDIDVLGALTLRGVAGLTSVDWAAHVQATWPTGTVDKVFELIGDYDDDRTVGTADYDVWDLTENSSGTELAADGDEDGDVDSDDYDIWASQSGLALAFAGLDDPDA
jgi:hypothetical protein